MPKPPQAHPSHVEAILDLIGEGLLMFTPKGEIALANKTAEEILEKKISRDNLADEIFGFSIHDALAHSQAPETLGIAYQTESGAQKELTIRTYFVDHHLLVIIHDVTEARRMEALAGRHDRMKELGDMVATVAHEIRNPLGGIRGFATLLHRDLQTQPQLQEMAQHIIEGADHLSQFVTNVLNYSRPAQAHFEPTELNALLDELRTHVQADSSLEPHTRLVCLPSASPVVALVDPHLLQSAVLNLVVNAIQAMPEGGELTLSVKQQEDRAILQVTDTGEGIPSENLSQLFTPFFTTRPKGNGFGLAEVKKIVQAHSGTIDVKSKLGYGTTFTLNLPLRHPS